MRLPSIVTLLAAVSANLSAATAERNDADAPIQSVALRGSGDASIYQSLLSAIEADELEEFESSEMELEQKPLLDQYDRELGVCGDGEKVFMVVLTTDKDGSGSSWKLFRYDPSAKNWVTVALGPDGAVPFGGDTQYTMRVCIDPAAYAFVMRDTNGQSPDYNCYLKGNKLFGKESDFSARKVHYFTYAEENSSSSGGSSSAASTPPPSPKPTPMPTRQPSPKPTPQPNSPDISGRLANCNSNERLFTMSLKADNYGSDTSWNLQSADGKTWLRNNRIYNNYEADTVEACIPEGAYTLTVLDNWGDGITGQGFYRVYIDGVLTYEGGKNFKKRTHKFDFRAQDMTERDQEWLDSHNTRRKKWHEQYGKSYVPLKWNNSLKSSSQVWAEQLLKTCGQSLYHDPNNKIYGENLASNSGSGSYAAVPSTEDILGRFVEWEQDWSWPRNAHLTQVLWRGSQHVGCAEMAKDMGNGKKCHVQVCRYARAGNCDVSSFNNGSNKWWMNAVMQDKSTCGDECPPDGCPL